MTLEIGEPGAVRIERWHGGGSVDLAALDALRGLEVNHLGFVARMIALFIDEAGTRVAELEAAAAAADHERMHRAAHTLKSGAAMVGAVRLSALCGEIQAATREGVAPVALVGPVAAEFERVAEILAGIVAQGESPHASR